MSEKSFDKRALRSEAIRMAWPAVLESFFVSLAGMIDTLMVSTLGAASVAAVGLTTQPKFIGLSFFLSMNIAVSALVARRKGEERQDNANEVLLTSLTYTLIMCLIVTLICVVFAGQIITLCGSNADTHDPAVLYFRIIMGGMFFNVVSLVINSAQRGSGNTKIAMTTNVVSSVINVIFNYLLIGGNFGFPRWGILGAAVATVLGTVAAMFMSVRSLFSKDSFVSIPYMIEKKIRPTWRTFVSLIRLGFNFFIENMAMRVGFLTTAVIAAKLGTNPFAAHQVGMNFLNLGFAFGDGMQVAAVALTGRSLGANAKDKALAYGKICQEIGLFISFVLAIIFFVCGRFLFSLYFSDPETIEMGVLISRYIMVTVLVQISQVVYGGCLRGAGDVRYTLFASLISVTLIRTLVTFVLAGLLNFGLHGIWLGILSDQLSRFLMLGSRFRKGEWVKLRL